MPMQSGGMEIFMKILFAASEAAPFVKTGGLGDVAQGLPAYLAKNSDMDVRVVIPFYKSIKDKNDAKIKFVTSFGVDLSWRRVHVGIFETVYKKVKYYFIDNEYYFNRDGCYGYFDDGERLAYFSKALLEMLMHIDFMPDVIHLNDWQTALVPAFLKTQYSGMEDYRRIKTLFTIHNIEYQGKASNEFLSEVLGFGEDMRGVMTFDDCINFMKSAIVLADKVSTVSETYSYEIRYSFYAHGLSGILKQYEYKIAGITNGIDTDLYNPAKDKNLILNYKPGELDKKLENKKYLQMTMPLEERPDVPVVSMISRLVSHKGLDLVEYICDEILSMDLQFVVLGTGDKRYEDLFKFLQWKYPGKMAANIEFNSALSSRVYAGSNMLLMPSQSEPCGLSQLIAMRYGTIPIVRETGGLNDTVTPINISTGEGCGFTFKGYNAHDMLGAIKRSIDYYYNKEKYTMTVKNIMRYNSSWKEPSQKYINLYNEIINY